MPPDEQRNENNKWLLAVVIILVSVPAGVGAAVDLFTERRIWDSVLISILFGIPVLAQVAGSIRLWDEVSSRFYRYYTFTTTICVWAYCLLWCLYRTPLRTYQLVSCMAVVITLALLYPVLVITRALINLAPANAGSDGAAREDRATRDNQFRRELRAGLAKHPFYAVVLFFSLFLGIAYILGFALAFHDQYAISKEKGAKPALYMTNVRSIDDPTQPPSQGAVGESFPPFYFYFAENQARVLADPPANNTQCEGNPPEMDEATLNDHDGKKQVDDERLSPVLCVHNQCTFLAMVKRLKDRTKGPGRVKVFLIGHSDDGSTGTKSSSYKSNYELSEARAESVKYRVSRMLTEEPGQEKADPESHNNIEWVCIPASDELLEEFDAPVEQVAKNGNISNNRSLTKGNRVNGKQSKGTRQRNEAAIAATKQINRVVKVLIVSAPDQLERNGPRPLNLMDYMYFSIYTITTTGYGDIIPTTAYAKFICSLSNILEVFFLVVFVNALLSLGAATGRAVGGTHDDFTN